MSRSDNKASGFSVSVALIDAERRSRRGFDCRVRGRPSWAGGFFERGFSAIAFDVHLEDCCVVDDAIDGGEGHGGVWEDFAPFCEGLVCGYEHGSSFVSGADELEEDAGLSLILGDVGEVIEDEEMVAIELVDGGFEGEFATSDLELLNEVGGAWEQDAPSVLDECETDRGSQMRLCRRLADRTAGDWRRFRAMRRRRLAADLCF